MTPAPRPGPLRLADLHGWRWLPCGCKVCYQRAIGLFSIDERCEQARALCVRSMDKAFEDLDPDRPRPSTAQAQLARAIASADLHYEFMDHYGPDPVADPDGARQWSATIRAQYPRYGWTPAGRPIHAVTDPDYGRARCVCGFVWADDHTPGDGTGCPEHLRPGRAAGSPADLLYRRRYAEWLADWRRGHIAS